MARHAPDIILIPIALLIRDDLTCLQKLSISILLPVLSRTQWIKRLILVLGVDYPTADEIVSAVRTKNEHLVPIYYQYRSTYNSIPDYDLAPIPLSVASDNKLTYFQKCSYAHKGFPRKKQSESVSKDLVNLCSDDAYLTHIMDNIPKGYLKRLLNDFSCMGAKWIALNLKMVFEHCVDLGDVPVKAFPSRVRRWFTGSRDYKEFLESEEDGEEYI